METVFVTIGSTSFDSLFDQLFTPETLEILKKRGCKHLIVQHGNYRNLAKAQPVISNWKAFVIELFDYAPSIEQYIRDADFVIGHAGAGTVIETLRKHKPLLIVVNDTLMGNHQEELAVEMSSSNYAFMAYPCDLRQTLSTLDLQTLVQFPAKQPLFGDFMKELLIVTNE